MNNAAKKDSGAGRIVNCQTNGDIKELNLKNYEKILN